MKRKNMSWKTIAVILAALFFTGVAAADTPDIPAPGITPDSPLYALEKASERLELAVAQAPIIGSEELEAKVRANHAAETLAEARAMAAENKTGEVAKLMNRYSENMNRSIESASATNQTKLKQRLANITDNQNRALEELDDRVPEQARKGIQKAMENNRQNQKKMAGIPGRKPAVHASKPGKPEQRTDNSQGGGSAPITGKSTAPGKSGSGTADERQAEKLRNKTSAVGSTGRETGSGKQEENISPDRDTAGGRSRAPDNTGSGNRP